MLLSRSRQRNMQIARQRHRISRGNQTNLRLGGPAPDQLAIVRLSHLPSIRPPASSRGESTSTGRRTNPSIGTRRTDDQVPSYRSSPSACPSPRRRRLNVVPPSLINLLFAKMTSASSSAHNLVERVFAPNLPAATRRRSRRLVGLLCGYFI